MENANQDNSILDLSRKNLKKIPKRQDGQNIRELILDENELQKIDNIDSFIYIEKLSICKNQLLRMYGVCRLQFVRDLNLSFNGILTIEGLKDLVNLTILNLEGNSIKTIEHLNTNTKLEYLNLSQNSISSISDLSFVANLKTLLLQGNRIAHLRQCEKYLPTSLETLNLAKNNITDLNEICTLSLLCNLNSIAINDNPAVLMCGNNTAGFDYRPFILNWCLTVKIIDGYVVNPIESLKAEWLYSQGRGRQFRPGEQIALARYLSSVCPFSGEALENENERKLRLILSKAQQHQRQLQEAISGDSLVASNNSSPSSYRRRDNASRTQSPRTISRLSGRQESPDSLSNSYHGPTTFCDILNSENNTNMSTSHTSIPMLEAIKRDNPMTQSLDPSELSYHSYHDTNSEAKPMHDSNSSATVEQFSQSLKGGPLSAASKMVPVPESLMSPDYFPPILGTKEHKTSRASMTKFVHNKIPVKTFVSHVRADSNNSQKTADGAVSTSDDDGENINIDKLKRIRYTAAQKVKNQNQNHNQNKQHDTNEKLQKSVILIQKIWRGYVTRKQTVHLVDTLRQIRTKQHIEKLTHEMEVTKETMEKERKIQQLQMQAINALWKKVSTMQCNSEKERSEKDIRQSSDAPPVAVVDDLVKTCSILTDQVEQLQHSLRDILKCVGKTEAIVVQQTMTGNSATQTELIAVHTPQIENLPFPFTEHNAGAKKPPRPATLQFNSQESIADNSVSASATQSDNDTLNATI